MGKIATWNDIQDKFNVGDSGNRTPLRRKYYLITKALSLPAIIKIINVFNYQIFCLKRQSTLYGLISQM